MIDASQLLLGFSRLAAGRPQPAPLLRCDAAAFVGGGAGATLGLVDGTVDPGLPDLLGAKLAVRRFAAAGPASPASLRHACCSAALLVGQGQRHLRGVVPHARLLLADVLGPGGSAEPAAVAEALAWLHAGGATVIAIPLGMAVASPAVAAAIDACIARGIRVLAAAGEGFPEPVSFPARHPGVIAVAAADRRGELLPTSGRCPRLDLLAPGKDIPAVVGRAGLRIVSGSSVACVLAAAAALLAARQLCSQPALLY